MTMKIFENLFKRMNKNRETNLKDKEYYKLRKELEYYKNRLAVIEDALNIKIYELEKRLEKLEQAYEKTDQIIRIVEALEPNMRRN
jgi:replicative DNA helicase